MFWPVIENFFEMPVKVAGSAGQYPFWLVCLNSTKGEFVKVL